MQIKNKKNNKPSFRYLLFLPFLFFTFCHQEKEVVTISPANELGAVKEAPVKSDKYEYCNEDKTKVYLCHEGRVTCVLLSEVKTHLDHGDTLGWCEK